MHAAACLFQELLDTAAHGSSEDAAEVLLPAQVGVALLHHLLETATLKVPVLDRKGMPRPGSMQVHLCTVPSIPLYASLPFCACI